MYLGAPIRSTWQSFLLGPSLARIGPLGSLWVLWAPMAPVDAGSSPTYIGVIWGDPLEIP